MDRFEVVSPFKPEGDQPQAIDKLAAGVLRDRARHCAASRFARAERLARAAPLKVWAALLLCLAPCTAVVLAFPLAQLLAKLVD